MKRILYIGNKLKNKTSNLSSIHTLGQLLEDEGFKVYYASSKSNKILRLLDMIFTFFKHFKKVNAVIIDTYSTHNFYYALVISQLCRLFRLDYFPSLNGGNLPARLKKNPKFSAMIFIHAKCNISPSTYLKSTFEDFGYQNIFHIPNNIEIKNYPMVIKTFDVPKLLWVRSFSKIYNPQLALKVMEFLKNTYPEIQLCMVGPDSDGTLKDLKKMAKDSNLNVKFTGKLSKNDWIDLSKNYNIFINTTNFDNTPVSVIEAMALGLPVVSTNVGGMPYLIENGKNGILVEPDNTEAMAQAILGLMYDWKNRNDIIKRAREKAEQFDWENVKKLWLQILS